MSDNNKKDTNKNKQEEALMKSYDSKIMRRLLSFFKPYKGYIILATILSIVIAALSAVTPLFTQIAIDEKIKNGDIGGLQVIILMFFGVLIVQGSLQYFMTYLTSNIGQKIVYDLRKSVFTHTQDLSLKFFDKNPIGRLVTRVTSDTEVLFEVFSSGLVTAFGDVFLLIWILYFMFTLDFQLTLVTLSVLPILIYATIVFRRLVRESYKKIRILVAQLNSYIQEHISGISIVQLFAQERRTVKEFEEVNREHTDENIRSIKYYAVFFPIVELISAITFGLIIWYGGVESLEGTITVGVIISFVQFAQKFFRPIRDLSEKYNILQTAMASSERIFHLLDEKNEVTDPVNPVEIKGFKGKIEFRNVWFAYKDEDYVLKNANFTINPGEKVAFVGATGAGKTTIINLISRFYDVNKGEILLDGVNIKDFRQGELREKIGVVLQDVFLFSGTIRSNITLDNPSITEERINAAVNNTGLTYFVNSLYDGLDHKVTERGSTLSVGQRQLISFARALAYDPQILILDEATSSVDTHTEILIQEATKKLIEGRTSIIIAHRLSTIQYCDKIIVMHRGEIKEMGTHQELVRQDGLYRRLYELQYKEDFIQNN